MVKMLLIGIASMLSVGVGAAPLEPETQAEAVVRTEVPASVQGEVRATLQTETAAETPTEAPAAVPTEAPAVVPTEAPVETQAAAPAGCYNGGGYCVNHCDENGDGYCDYCNIVWGSAGQGRHHSGHHGHGGRHCR